MEPVMQAGLRLKWRPTWDDATEDYCAHLDAANTCRVYRSPGLSAATGAGTRRLTAMWLDPANDAV